MRCPRCRADRCRAPQVERPSFVCIVADADEEKEDVVVVVVVFVTALTAGENREASSRACLLPKMRMIDEARSQRSRKKDAPP